MKKLVIIYLLATSVPAALAQELRLTVYEQPLNTVLNMLHVEISFDDRALAGYRVSVSKTFASPEEAINYLLTDKPFKVKKMGNVFVISPVFDGGKKPEPVVEKKFIISGELSDLSTGEPLPYAHVQTDKCMTVANESGMFTIVRSTDQPVRIQVRYIGFESLDTVLYVGKHRLSLSSETFAIEEVTVRPSPSAMLMQSGKTSGEIRINHQIARYMPGSADNSVWTLLRMMPGVRSSGEPSDDLLVWGGNWGESRLIYDGFTIFGMKSFNEQIGSVNPYMAKDVRLMKGGYDASHGNRIGAIAEVTGNEGDFGKPSLKANISNYTANLFASVPLKKTSALSVACRQTFYNLYDGTAFGGSNDGHGQGHGQGQQTPSDIYISPKYDFRDLNLKYAGKTSVNDRYYVSLYGADDRFESSVTQQDYTVNAAEHHRQYGAAAGYNRVWNSGNISKIRSNGQKLG